MKPVMLRFKLSSKEPIFENYNKEWINTLIETFAEQHNFAIKRHNGSVTIEAKLVMPVPVNEVEAHTIRIKKQKTKRAKKGYTVETTLESATDKKCKL